MNPAFMLADSAGAGGFIPAVYDLGIPSTSTIVYAVPIEGDTDAVYELSADSAGAGVFIPAVYDLGIPSTSTIVYAVPLEGGNDALYESADQGQSLA